MEKRKDENISSSFIVEMDNIWCNVSVNHEATILACAILVNAHEVWGGGVSGVCIALEIMYFNNDERRLWFYHVVDSFPCVSKGNQRSSFVNDIEIHKKYWIDVLSFNSSHHSKYFTDRKYYLELMIWQRNQTSALVPSGASSTKSLSGRLSSTQCGLYSYF